MTKGLNNSEAARLAGCTPKAIRDAKESGRIPQLADGSVTRRDVQVWNSGRRAPRGKSAAQVAPGALLLSPLVSTPGMYPDMLGPLVSIAVMARTAGLDAAEAILRHVDDETLARAVADDVTAKALLGAAELALEDFAPAPGYEGWRAHPLFLGQLSHEDPIEWAEMVADAAASRKASK